MRTGIGAVFYVEHTRHLFPETGEARTLEEDNLTAAMIPGAYYDPAPGSCELTQLAD